MQICTYIINRRIKDMQLNRSVVICIIYHNYIIKYLVWRGRVWGFTHTKKKKIRKKERKKVNNGRRGLEWVLTLGYCPFRATFAK